MTWIRDSADFRCGPCGVSQGIWFSAPAPKCPKCGKRMKRSDPECAHPNLALHPRTPNPDSRFCPDCKRYFHRADDPKWKVGGL